MTNRRSSEFLLLTAILFTNLGNACHLLVLGKFLFDLTGGIRSFGQALVLEQVFAIAVSLVAGAFIDRWPVVRSVVLTEALRGLAVIASGLLLWVSPGVALIYLMILAIQIGRPFYKSGYFALEIALIQRDRLPHYNSRSVSFMQLGSILGMWIAGAFIAWQIPVWGFVLNGLTFLISAVCTHFAGKDFDQATGWSPSSAQVGSCSAQAGVFSSIVTDWKRALAIAREDLRLVGGLVLGGLDFALAQVFNVLLILIVMTRLSGDAFWLSALDSGFAVGAMLVGSFAGYLVQWRGKAFAILFGISMQTLCFVILGIGENGISLLLGAALLGAANTVSWTGWQTWLQEKAPKNVRGKISVLRHLITSVTVAAFVAMASRLEGRGLEFVAGAIFFIAGTWVIATTIFFFTEGRAQRAVQKECLP